MANIPNEMFSKFLFKYPKLWGDVAAKELAAKLTQKLGYRVTMNDVRYKIKLIKSDLRELDKSKETKRNRLDAFLRYALRLGVRNAADRITQQLISDGTMKINVRRSSEDFRGFEETNRENDSRVPNLDKLIGETIDEKTMELIDKYIDDYTEETVKDHFNEMIDHRIKEIVTATFGGTMREQTTTSQSPANIDINKGDYLDIYDDGPSTSAAAALRLAVQHRTTHLQQK
uniref:Uncharacterized protein n=1 Tax=Glossina pallidipes TaxID=7398 RepID=A0A1A9Z2K2_GLOPL